MHGLYEDHHEYDAQIPQILAEWATLIAAGKLHVPIAVIYPPEFNEAIAHMQGGGKVLLKIKED